MPAVTATAPSYAQVATASVPIPASRPIAARARAPPTAAAPPSGTARARRSRPPVLARRQAATPTTAAIIAPVGHGARANSGTSPSTYATAITATISGDRVRPLG